MSRSLLLCAALGVAVGGIGLILSLTTTAGSATATAAAAAVAPACPSAGSDVSFGFLGDVKVISETDVPVCTTGTVTVSFRGARTAGCGRAGLCGYTGTDSWEPGTADLSVLLLRVHGRRQYFAVLSWNGDHPLVSSVGHAVSTGRTIYCRDSQGFSPTFEPNLYTPGGARGGVVRIRLLGEGAATLSTRCAGPLDVDVQRAAPARSLLGAQTLKASQIVSFAGTKSFAAHGLAGTVQSTVVLRTGTPEPTLTGGSAEPKRRHPTEREVTVTYHVARFSGRVLARWQAVRRPGCDGLGACGSTGTSLIAPRAKRGESLQVDAFGPLRRPYRDFLAALGLSSGGDPHGIFVNGSGSWRDPGSVVSRLGPRVIRCVDTAHVIDSSFTLVLRGRQLRVAYQPVTQAADPLRTRCPGPALGNHAAATGVVPVSSTGHGNLTVNFGSARSFLERGYSVRVRPHLSLSLTRTAIVSRTY